MSEPEKLPEPIDETIARFQERFPGVEKKRFNSFTNSNYASLDDIWNAAFPHMRAVGINTIAWVETIAGAASAEGGPITSLSTLKVCLFNKDRQKLESELPLPNAAEQPQKVGSALTYYRRYLICTMLGVVAETDDDGNATKETSDTDTAISADQLKKINELIALTKTNKSDLLAYVEESYHRAALEHLTYAQAAIIIKMLEHKQTRNAQ